ncbi:NtaA/DmoA family FMN-dependent monooxygenase [Streptomyces amakusaensis]|uniref:LLM class flavin-dependent oxidoreductase n=1 Tax=Streptomyces amakusaensis TaxID=67271 RepID=A0ABW0AHW1_9ACTN
MSTSSPTSSPDSSPVAGRRTGGAPILLLNAQYLPTSKDWRTADGRADSPFHLGTFVREAQRAEAAGFDALFQADFSGVNRAALRSGPPLQLFESFQAAAVIAGATSRIKVMPTVSTMYAHPSAFARSLASLDRLSEGRAWINVVSSFRPGTAIGVKREVSRSQHHAQAEEFLKVAKELWASWPPEANTPDPVTGHYIREGLIKDVQHQGEFYRQSGPIDMAPYSAAFPFTLQATSSLTGVRLAARTADGVFAGTPTLGAAKELRRILRREAVAAGRPADSVALLPGSYIHVVGTREEAELLLSAERARTQVFGGQLAVEQLRARYPGLRLDGVGPADRIPADLISEDPDKVFEEFGSRYLPLWDLARTEGRKPGRTVGEFAAEVISLSEHARFIGTAEQIGDELRRWYDEGGVDGFQTILGNEFEALCERVIPRFLGKS